MNKILSNRVFYLLIVLITLSLFVLTSCGKDDDDDEKNENSIIVHEGVRYEKSTMYANSLNVVGLEDDTVTDLVIPGTVNGMTVKNVKSGAFANNDIIKTATINAHYIEEDAFKDCDALTKVTVSSMPVSSDNNSSVFSGCDNLKELICGYAFFARFSLGYQEPRAQITKVTIIHSQTAYFEITKESYPLLEEIIFSEGVTEIPVGFNNFLALKKVTIPSTMKKVDGLLWGCESLSEIHISDIKAYLDITVYSGRSLTDGNAKLYLNGSLLTKVVIPEGVTAITSRAFLNQSQITEVILPEGLTVIGEEAFSKTSISALELPSTVKEIQRGAFSYTNISEITLPEGIEKVSGFRGTDISSVVIPSTVKSLGGFAETKITSITIPEGVIEISDYAFEGSQLTKAIIPDSVTYIGKSAFKNTKIREVSIPSSATVGGEAFSGSYTIGRVTIGENVTFDNNHGAFYGRTVLEVYAPANIDLNAISLTKVTVTHNDNSEESAVTFIDDYCFVCKDGAYSLEKYYGDEKELFLPDGVNEESYSISSYAIDNDKVRRVTVPACVTSLKFNAIYSVKLNYLKFYGAPKLDSQAINSDYCYNLWEVYYPGNRSFSSRITHHLDPNEASIIDITDDGFAFVTYGGLAYLAYYDGENKNIVLPESYNSASYVICSHAFYDTGLESVKIPDSAVLNMMANAFKGENKLPVTDGDGIYIDKWLVGVADGAGDDEIFNVRDGTVGIASKACRKDIFFDQIIIPESVRYIGDEAFARYPGDYSKDKENNSAIVKGELLYLGNMAFRGTRNIISITFADGALTNRQSLEYCYVEELTVLGNVYMNGTSKLFKDLTIGSLVYRGNFAITVDSARFTANNVTLTDGVTFDLSTYVTSDKNKVSAFTVNDNLYIGKDVTVISGDKAGLIYTEYVKEVHVENIEDWIFFAKCLDNERNNPLREGAVLYVNGEAPTEIVIPEGVEEIPAYTFKYVSGVTTVTLPNSLKKVCEESFYNPEIMTVKGGAGLVEIGKNAFYEGVTFEETVYGNIIYKLNVPISPVSTDITWARLKPGSVIPDRFFEGCEKLAFVYIPSGCTFGERLFIGTNYSVHVMLGDEGPKTGAWRLIENDKMLGDFIFVGGVSNGDKYGNVSINCPIYKDFTYKYSSKEVVITGYFGESENPVLPGTLEDGTPIAKIDSYAFRNRDGIKSLTVNAGGVNPYYFAFMGNSTIESVSLGSANVIYDFSFNENTTIKSVVIEYNAEKELYIQTAFAGCTSLTEIVLPKNLHYVAVGAFSGCESLRSVFFGGTSEEWASVEVENELNDEFLSASLYFYSETEPADTEGLYWHYVDGVATPW